MSMIKKEDRPEVKVSNPLSICWQITKTCQLKCSHCIANSNYQDKNRKELETQEIIKILDKLWDWGVRRIDFSGGDPLLKKDILKILDYCYKKGFKLVITTNGLIYSKKISKLLKKVHCLIQISIDGDRKIHDKIRGAGHFEETVNNLKKFQLDGNPIRINFTISKINYKKIDYIYNLAKKLKVSRLMYIFVAPQGRGYQVEKDVCLDKKTKEKVLNQVKKIEINSKKVFITIHDYEVNFKSCFLIEPDGMVVSQGYSQDECINVGNICSKPFSYLWNTKDFDQLQHLIQYSYMLE